ncbi:MAG: sulfate ABC transporter substrate-binding protein [Anaerolineae bacterium]|nr:sulfate ABC transporter substrate-binding protein [Anaerolineae bacterium]
MVRQNAYQLQKSRKLRFVAAALLIALVIVGQFGGTVKAQSEITLTLAGFAVPREAYAEIIPLFQAYWEQKTGQKVIFNESYIASGAQSRAIVGGFEADIAALSISSDITRIVDAGLITTDWTDNTYKGIVTDSVVVLAVRKDNPKNIQDWADIAKEGVEVITPDPATSGGAQWNLLGAYGAAKRGNVEGIEKGDEGALAFLAPLIKNVSVFDKDGRESFLTFERGIGDVAITYENEAYSGQAAGTELEIIRPKSTILIENPIAVVDVYTEKHGTTEVAKAFVEFLYTPEAQTVFAQKGFRPLLEEVAKDAAFEGKFPEITDLFTIEEFGGWGKVRKELFGDEGAITKLIAEVKGQQ